MISVVRPRLTLSGLIGRTFLRSSWCEQRLTRRVVRTDELLVLLVEYPMALLQTSDDFWSCCVLFCLE